MKRFLMRSLIAALLVGAPYANAAVPANWKDSSFAINASGMTLRQVLQEFGSAYGVHVAISASADMVLKGRVQGATGSEFLERLSLGHKFRWFVYNDTLNIVPGDDYQSMRLEIGEDAVGDAKAALVGLGLFDSRFGWGEIPDEGVVVVSGPREYVNLVRTTLLTDGKKAVSQGKQVMVFRLKYASATDRVISTRGQQEKVPGIKTILTNLLTKDSQASAADDRDRLDLHGARSRRNGLGAGAARELKSPRSDDTGRMQGGDKLARNDYDNGDEGDGNRPKMKNGAPRIEADSSLNAIIIYDNANKREMYQNLIAEIDIEPQQVEIEALIVDIDRNKLAEMGAEWSFALGAINATVNGSGADSQGVNLPLPGSTLLIKNAASFYARLKAMEGTGEAHVLAKPTVMTLDNVAAVLDLSQTVYLPLVGERVADVVNVTAGTMLKVLPRIVREGANTRVRMDIDIEDGVLGNVSGKTNATRSTVSTQAIIEQQQTLMIGGYHQESTTQDLKKVPFLGDIPVLGGLFRNSASSTKNRERLFLITPRLIGASGIPAAARSSASEQARRLVPASDDPVAAVPAPVSFAVPATTMSIPVGGRAAAIPESGPAVALPLPALPAGVPKLPAGVPAPQSKAVPMPLPVESNRVETAQHREMPFVITPRLLATVH
ncbi:type III secretion system outer membrane ring subunit SctC [Paraherbaspirillum soli]|uniref:Type 3 secretion system secretin n=1 Tax=Paraherbaspirillum soli TaxID=631222 RepID=A0ABW0MAH2_9BURK